MRYLTDLPIADLRTAGDAIETLIDFRAYTPPGHGFLITLAGKFRDDIRDVLEMPLLEHAYRGHEVKSLDDLAAEELDHLDKAVDVLVGRFTPFMDDPELVIQLGALHEHLRAETARREAVLREEATALRTTTSRSCRRNRTGRRKSSPSASRASPPRTAWPRRSARCACPLTAAVAVLLRRQGIKAGVVRKL